MGSVRTAQRSSSGSEPQVDVLLVEDNRTTATLMQRVLSDLESVGDVEVFRDGAPALAHLEHEAPDLDVDLVLLDLGLPEVGGHEVLETMRDEMGLLALPVVIVSSSDDPEDVRQAYEAGANGYMQKPLSVEGLQDLEEALEGFWLGSAELPQHPGQD